MSYIPLPEDPNNNVLVRLSQHDIFDQIITSERHVQVNAAFFSPTNQITDLVATATTGTGTAVMSGGTAAFQSGTGTTSSVTANTYGTTHYVPGFEIYTIFTSTWTTPTSAASSQYIGLWDGIVEGFYMGYSGTTYGIAVMTGGVENFTPRSSWNGDPLDGSATSKFTRSGVPEAINFTYLNVFRIRFGWLGSAPVLFEVSSPDGTWVVFHTILQPNTTAVPSVQNPNLPVTLKITKTASDSTNLKMNCGCWAAGTTSVDVSGISGYEKESWTSVTTVGKTLLTETLTAGNVSFSAYNTGTISAGVLAFEATPDNINWYPLTVVSTLITEPGITTYNLINGSNTWQAFIGGYSQVRIRLTTAITGAGSVAVAIRPTNSSAATAAQVYQPLGTNLHTVVDSGTVTVTTSTTGNAPTAASVGVTSATVLASNALRKGVVFTNTSTRTISFGLNGATAVLNSGITLSPNGIWVMDQYTFTTGAITAIASGATSNLAIQEMQ